MRRMKCKIWIHLLNLQLFKIYWWIAQALLKKKQHVPQRAWAFDVLDKNLPSPANSVISSGDCYLACWVAVAGHIVIHWKQVDKFKVNLQEKTIWYPKIPWLWEIIVKKKRKKRYAWYMYEIVAGRFSELTVLARQISAQSPVPINWSVYVNPVGHADTWKDSTMRNLDACSSCFSILMSCHTLDSLCKKAIETVKVNRVNVRK